MASRLAIHGGTPVRTRAWPPWPDHREEDVQAVAVVVASGKWWQHAGEEVARFEEEFAAYHDTQYGITVTSGTSALHVALLALGIGAGDEVIVPAYTFQATAASVLLTGATPVFADVELGTMNLDVVSAARAVTPRTKAMMPVHFAGLPAAMTQIRALADEHGVFVVEDAAQAHGAVSRGQKVGAIGQVGGFSFQASKNLCAGEGGFITTNDRNLAARAAGWRDCGYAQNEPVDPPLLGVNYRMTEMQGALLRSRLRHLEVETEWRNRNGQRLTAQLLQLPGVKPLDPEPAEGDRRAYHLYCIHLDQEALQGQTREWFMEALRAEGIPVSGGYTHPVYAHPAFTSPRLAPGGCLVAERLCREAMWLPQNLFLGTEADTGEIARAFEKVVEAGNRE